MPLLIGAVDMADQNLNCSLNCLSYFVGFTTRVLSFRRNCSSLCGLSDRPGYGPTDRRRKNITSLPLDTSPLGENPWLAGFIEGDGGFQVRYTEPGVNSETGPRKRKRKGVISCMFRIEQRQTHPKTCRAVPLSGSCGRPTRWVRPQPAPAESYEPMLSSIAHFLGVKLKVTKHHNPPVEYFDVATCSQASNQVLVVYLTQFPLMGTKGLGTLIPRTGRQSTRWYYQDNISLLKVRRP
jgi:hypothetical protein